MTENLRLGPYEAREFVARHAHGSVCRVTGAAGAGALTAKLYAPTGSPRPEQLRRWHDEFAAEVDALRAHGHDLVPIRDRGRAGDMAWVVTEAPRGKFLSELIDAGPPALAQAVEIVGKIAAALDRLHRSNLVHRSLKPSNIVIDPDGEVRFMDAVLLGRLAEAILAGSLPLDRVACVAPESVLGYRQRPASNVHALSVIAYRALCGSWPHDETSSVDYAYACVYSDHVPLSARSGTWGSAVGEVIDRGLAKEPEDRFPTCVEFADALAHACSHDAEEASAPVTLVAVPSPEIPLGPRLVEAPAEVPVENVEEAAAPPIQIPAEVPSAGVEDAVEPPGEADPEAAAEADPEAAAEQPAGEPAALVVDIDAVDLAEVETLIPDLDALPTPLPVDPDAVLPEIDLPAAPPVDPPIDTVELADPIDTIDLADPIVSAPFESAAEPEVAAPTAAMLRGPGIMQRMRVRLAGALAGLGARVAGRTGTASDHRMREDYLADWRARTPSPGVRQAPLEDPVVPEWRFRVEPAEPAWLRIDGRYAGPAPAEVTIRGRAGADVRIEVMRDGACIAAREVRLHPLMEKVWDLRADA
jgi:serine/threonine-protein kinase